MPRRIRVAIVAPSLDILGGQSVQADALLRAWTDDPDVEAWLVPINPTLPESVRWAARIKYLRTIATECTYIPTLSRSLQRADLVHVFSASYWSFLLAPVPAVMVARHLNKPVIVNYHSGEAPDHLARSATARWVLRDLAQNVVPSEFLVRVFRHAGLAATAIPNVVDVSRFAFRERPQVAPKILSTRSFETLYNVACTIRAFRLVRDRHPGATLTLAGGGSQEPVLRRMAAELDLYDVTFAGRVHPEEMPGLFARHDIYLQSPDIDNMPLSVLEAFASGLPVVTTDVGGIPDLVTTGTTGLVAQADDHEALAAHVLELVTYPTLAAKLAKTAAASLHRFEWGSVRPQWLAQYQGTLAIHDARTRVSATAALDALGDRQASGRES